MAELTSTSVFFYPRWKLSSFLFRIKLTTSRDPGGNFWTRSLGWVSQSSIGNFFWTLDLSTYLKYSSIYIARNTFGFFMPLSHEKIRKRHNHFVMWMGLTGREVNHANHVENSNCFWLSIPNLDLTTKTFLFWLSDPGFSFWQFQKTNIDEK